MPDLPPFPPDPDAPDAPGSAEPSSGADERQERSADGDGAEPEASSSSGLDELRQVLITRLGETQQSLLGLIEHFQAEQRRAVGEAESKRFELEQELASLRDDRERALEAAERERAEQRESLAAAEQARAEAEQALEAERARASEAPPPAALAAPASAGGALIDIRRSIAALDAASTQTEVLSRLLEEATAHAGRAALLLPKDRPDRLDVWNATGFGDALEPGSAVEPPESLRPALEGRPVAGEDVRWDIDDLAPTDAVAIPLILRDRVRAVLYADRTDGSQPFAADALQILTYCASGALETLPLRSIRPAGTLVDVTSEPAFEPADEPELLEDRDAEANAAMVAVETPEVEALEVEAPQLEAWSGVEAEEAESLGAALETPADGEAVGSAEQEPAGVSLEPADDSPWTSPAAATSEEAEAEKTGGEETEAEENERGEHTAGEHTVGEHTAEGWPEVLAASSAPSEQQAEIEAEVDAEASTWDLLEEPEPSAPPSLTVPPPLPSSSPAAPETVTPRIADWARPVAEPAADAAADEANAQTTTEEDHVAVGQGDEAAPPPPLVAREALDESPLEEAGDGPGARPSPFARAALDEDEDEEEHDEDRADVEQFRTQAIRLDQISARAPGTERAQMRSSEVVPPSDVQGPGWAFTGAALGGSSVANEDPMHEEARRLARLLVSEIKLYNEEQIEEGRRQGNIYRFLKEPIDRSRVLYEERIDARVRSDSDYYHEELIRSLANGDRSLLGI